MAVDPSALTVARLLEKAAPLETDVAVALVRAVVDEVAARRRAGEALGTLHPADVFIAVSAPSLRVTLRDEASRRPAPTDSGSDSVVTSEVRSLGLLMFEALAGEPPNDAMIDEAGQEGTVRPARSSLRRVAPWVEADVAVIVERALEQDAKGFPDAAALGEALARCSRPGSPAALAALVEEAATAVPEQDPTAVPTVDVGHDDSVDGPDHDFAAALIGHELGGRYRLERTLGEGGMGAVFEASRRDGERFAVKLVRPDAASPSALRRFLREARAVMKVDSAHVVRTVEARVDERIPYLVLELLRGRDLARTIATLGPLDPPVAARIIADACEGLTAVHDAGLVHRDIKPSNIFLHEEDDGTVTVKLCDFGIAKESMLGAQSTALTRTGGIVGTPAFMSPEQAHDSRHVDARSDVWSVCASLYHALSGQPPWEGSNVGEILAALYSAEVPPLASAAPWVSERLAAIAHRGLVRDPAVRLGSARQLRALLLENAAPAPLRASDLRGVSESSRKAPHRLGADSPATGAAAAVRVAPEVRGRWLLPVAVVIPLIGGLTWLAARGRAPTPPAPIPTPVEAAPQCAGAKQCSETMGRPARCREDGRCAALESELCSVDAERDVVEDDRTVWIGTMFPSDHPDRYMESFGRASERAVSLAARELHSVAGGVPTSDGRGRKVGLITCRDAVDPAAAARHLVEEVNVPVVIGFGSSKSVVDLSSTLFIRRDVLAIAALNPSAIITSIPHPAASPRLVWRTAANTKTRVDALAGLVPGYVEQEVRAKLGPRGARTDLTVALVAGHTATSVALAADVAARLRFNGRTAAENGAHFREFQLLDKDGTPLREERTVASLLVLRPHIVILGDIDTETVQNIVLPLEERWESRVGHLPTYVVTGSLEGETLGELLRRHPTVEDRLLGITPPTRTPANLSFTRSYNAAYGEELPPEESPAAPYDSFFLVVHALAAGAADSPSGANLARAIERLLPPGEPIEAGPTQLLSGFSVLARGENIDLRGAFSPMDFDPKTGESTLDYSVLCARVANGKHHFLESGLRWDALERKLVGKFDCVLR